MDTAEQEQRIYEIAGLLIPFASPFPSIPSLSFSLFLWCCPQQVVVLLNFCIVIYNLIDLCPRPWLYSDGIPFWRKVPFRNIGLDNGPAANSIYNSVLPPLDTSPPPFPPPSIYHFSTFLSLPTLFLSLIAVLLNRKTRAIVTIA